MHKLFLALFFLVLTGSVSCQDKVKGGQKGNEPGAINENLEVNDFQKKLQSLQGVQLVDVRTPAEFEEGHLKGALNYDWRGADFEKQATALDKSKPVMLYCLGGGRSAAAGEKLQSMGFTTVYNMQGGFLKWTEANKPVEYPASALDKRKGMTQEDYLKMVSATKDKFVLVDFSAKWCGPCQKMMPMLHKMAEEKKDKVQLLIVDADEHKSLLKEKGISSIPYFEMYKNGKLVWKGGGYMDEETFLKETGL